MNANYNQQAQAPPAGQNRALLVIIAIFLPWVSVLLLEGCGVETIVCLLLTWLFWIPGFIYALYLIFRDPKSDAPVGAGLNNQINHQQYQQAPAQSYQHRAEAPVQAPTAYAAEKPPAVDNSHEITEPTPSYPNYKQ